MKTWRVKNNWLCARFPRFDWRTIIMVERKKTHNNGGRTKLRNWFSVCYKTSFFFSSRRHVDRHWLGWPSFAEFILNVARLIARAIHRSAIARSQKMRKKLDTNECDGEYFCITYLSFEINYKGYLRDTSNEFMQDLYGSQRVSYILLIGPIC